MLPLLSAQVYLHGIGITHRDIKPENLLLDERGKFSVLSLLPELFLTQPNKGVSRLFH